MELQDNCAICRMSMLRKEVKRMLPCRHLLHGSCAEQVPMQLINENEVEVQVRKCPVCRTTINDSQIIERKTYRKYTDREREMIVTSANRGDDWVALSKQLNITYKTAYHWVRSGNVRPNQKDGKNPKILSEEEIDVIIEWIEEECDLTLIQIKDKIMRQFNKSVATATIGNYLEGRMFTVKQIHTEPITMNSPVNKNRRAEYVRTLNLLIEQGKQIVWIDETNFNLFCRRTRGRAKAGTRAVQLLPAAKGPNVHLIGAISAAGVLSMERRRGSFTAQSANAWIESLLQRWQDMGNQLVDLVIVADNAPCHSSLENVIDGTPATLLRLSPYSPMLNPIEIIWSKIKSYVKRQLRIPNVEPPGVIEQRLVYLEGIIDQAKNTERRAVQHTTIHHAAALAREDMHVGR